MTRPKTGSLATLGAVGAAVLASLCCIGPLVFVVLGVGAGLASTFEPLRPIFTALTAVFLGVGFYVVYGRRPSTKTFRGVDGAPDGPQCGSGDACNVSHPRKRERILLWAATGIALVLWTFPYWSLLLV
ncbi:MAG: mercuric transporter MerT family protein [Acidimicrobiia bacterium]